MVNSARAARILGAIVVGVAVLVTVAPVFAKEPQLIRDKTLTVVDANGHRVGQLINLADVVFEFAGRLFFVGVKKTGFVKNSSLTGPTLFFAEKDCMGTPFVDVDEAALVEQARIAEPGSTVYLPDLTDIRQNFQAESLILSIGGCGNVPQTRSLVAPEVPLLDLDTIFTPPFEVH